MKGSERETAGKWREKASRDPNNPSAVRRTAAKGAKSGGNSGDVETLHVTATEMGETWKRSSWREDEKREGNGHTMDL